MSRESESHANPAPGIARRTMPFGRFPAFAGTRRGKATLAIAAAALLGAGTLSTASYMGADLAGQVAKGAQSVMSLMKQRSPGARTGDKLTKLKGRKYAVLAASVPAPQEASLPTAAPAVAGPFDIAPGPAPVAQLAQLGPIFAPPLGGGVFFPPPGGGSGGPPPPWTEWPPPDCCSGGVGPPSGPPGPPRPPGPPGPPGPTPGVPEPATWAMMLFGFATIGWAMRGQRVRAQRAGA